MKVDVEYLEFMWPMRHFLITCGSIEGNKNIITISFCMPVSREPPLLACAIGINAYSVKLIKEYKEFIVNVPDQNLKKQIYYCGFHSGTEVDKFKETGLTCGKARDLKTPIITECAAHMECKVENEFKTGDKILFIGKVIQAYADEKIINEEKKFSYAQGEFPHKIYAGRFKKNE